MAGASRTERAEPGHALIGFVLSHEQFSTPELVDNARRAEQAGFHYTWTSDHSQPWQDNQGHSMFPWLTLALVGERTSRVVFGSGVTCPTYRYHPSQVAQAFASLAVLSPGRVFLGVGTGEAINELACTGQFGRYQERHDRLVEAIELIRKLWTGDRICHDGHYYQTEQLKLYDIPQQPIPIYMAASGPRSAHTAGRLSDGWIAQERDFLDPAMREAFAAGARSVGKDPDAMPIFVERFVVVGDHQATEYSAEQWTFAGSNSSNLIYEPDPSKIQRFVEQTVARPDLYANWSRGEDLEFHIAPLQSILDLGGTPVLISGQLDQSRVIDFYGQYVLPELRHGRAVAPAT